MSFHCAKNWFSQCNWKEKIKLLENSSCQGFLFLFFNSSSPSPIAPKVRLSDFNTTAAFHLCSNWVHQFNAGKKHGPAHPGHGNPLYLRGRESTHRAAAASPATASAHTRDPLPGKAGCSVCRASHCLAVCLPQETLVAPTVRVASLMWILRRNCDQT